MMWMCRMGTWLAVVLACVAARGEDFRIESKVFLEPQAVPRSVNLTLFHKGIVYDYGSNPREITILDADPQRARMILLNPMKKLKTEIKLATIDEFVAGLRKAAAEAPNPLMNFLASPTFTKGYEPMTKELLLSSEFLDYRLLTTTAPTEDVAQQYRQFSDCYAKLNTLTNVASIPPFARIQVNSILSESRQIPQDVKLVLKGAGPAGKDIILRSEHRVAFKLLQDDLQRILATDEMFAKYPAVDAKEYFQPLPEDTATKPTPEKPMR